MVHFLAAIMFHSQHSKNKKNRGKFYYYNFELSNLFKISFQQKNPSAVWNIKIGENEKREKS